MIGPLGAILAIPLSLMAKALLVDIDPSTRWADVLLTSTMKPDQAQRAGPQAEESDGAASDGAASDGSPDSTASDDTTDDDRADRPAPGTSDS